MQRTLDAADGREEVAGVLVDADYITHDDGRAWVRLWFEDGRVAFDPGFEPYFYCLPHPDADVDALAAGLADLTADEARVVETAVVAKRHFGEERDVVRVVVHHPGNVPPLREKARALSDVEQVLEADVPFAYRYIIDRSLRPMDRVRVRGERSDGRLVAEEVVAEPMEGYPELKVMAFDLEVHNPDGMPDEARDPIVICSVARNYGPEEERELQLLADGEDDEQVVRDFVDLVRDDDPDVIVTYNGDSFDWPYLISRADKHGIDLAVGRDGREPRTVQAGPWKLVRVSGRNNVDLYRVVERDIDDVKHKKLERVADHLGVMDEDAREHVPKDEIARYWDDPDGEGLRDELIDYAADDARSTLEMGEKLLPLQMELARHVRQTLEDVSKMGRGRQVEWYLRAEAHQVGELVPDQGGGRGGSRYEGGFVLDPRSGVHEEIVCLDFSAMYPSIMMAYNISPDTLLTDGGEVDAHEAPEVGHRFRKSPPGFFTRIIRDLVESRRELKADLAELDPGSEAYTLLDIRQRTLKILTNSFYGYMGWPAARWYRRECAEATSAWGRHLIRQVMEMARDRGFEVYYGDTDSLFVDARDDLDDFLREVNEELPLDLEIDDVYDVIFFTSSKKRYAGLTDAGELVVKGLETRRGDWCDLAKELQQEVIRIILEERDVEQAVDHVREVVESVREGDVEVDQIAVHKTLTMDPDSYKSKQAHAEAVRRAREEHGYEPTIGAKVGYLILDTGDDLLSERSELLEYVDEDDAIDYGYYVEKQLLPAAMRVLEHFDVTEEQLLGEPEQQDLQDFF